MAERKVLNKYFPPDFDPTKLARRKSHREMRVVVRMMLPMNVQCKTCGEYMYRGTKFNSTKEDVQGEDYLGIRLYRFYMKCIGCSAKFSIKTDPKNTDYTCEFGVSRNFEPWRMALEHSRKLQEKRDEEEIGDAMKALENRTEESKQELDILDSLAEMKEQNTRLDATSIESALESVRKREKVKKDRACELNETEKQEIKDKLQTALQIKQDSLDAERLEDARRTNEFRSKMRKLGKHSAGFVFSPQSENSSSTLKSSFNKKPTKPFFIIRKSDENSNSKIEEKNKTSSLNFLQSCYNDNNSSDSSTTSSDSEKNS